MPPYLRELPTWYGDPPPRCQHPHQKPSRSRCSSCGYPGIEFVCSKCEEKVKFVPDERRKERKSPPKGKCVYEHKSACRHDGKLYPDRCFHCECVTMKYKCTTSKTFIESSRGSPNVEREPGKGEFSGAESY